MTEPMREFRVWARTAPARQPIHIYVRNLAEALVALATIEGWTAYETVHGCRDEHQIDTGVQRFETTPTGNGWFPVQDWELDAVQEVLDAEAA